MNDILLFIVNVCYNVSLYYWVMCSIPFQTQFIYHFSISFFISSMLSSVYDPMLKKKKKNVYLNYIWNLFSSAVLMRMFERHRWHIDCLYWFYWSRSWWLIWSSQDTVLISAQPEEYKERPRNQTPSFTTVQHLLA